MNRPSDLDARLCAWLEEGPTNGPDEVLSRTFARARSTHQDRAWLPYLIPHTRFPMMNSTLKVAAMAVLAFAAWVGVSPFLQHAATVGDAPPSPSPSPIVLPSAGALEGGSYYVNAGPEIAPARFTFTVPAGWTPSDGAVSNGAPEYPAAGWEQQVGFETWILTHVFTDACQHTTLVAAGTTVQELTTALLAQQSVTTSGPTDVTVAGYPAQQITLGVPTDLDVSTCTNGKIRFWPGPGPDMSAGMCCIFGPGSTVTIDVVDVDGHRWVVAARTGPGATEPDRLALQDVLASIQIESPAPSPTLASSPMPVSSGSPAPSGSPSN